jgi:hypothetical protein
MNKKTRKIVLNIMIVFIFITCSPSLYAGEKSKAGSPAVKDQRIAVTPIDSEELNFCGNRAGGFGAVTAAELWTHPAPISGPT